MPGFKTPSEFLGTGASGAMIPDNTSEALDIESTDGKNWIVADTTNDADELLFLSSFTASDNESAGRLGIRTDDPKAIVHIVGKGGKSDESMLPAITANASPTLILDNGSGNSSDRCAFVMNGNGSQGSIIDMYQDTDRKLIIQATDTTSVIRSNACHLELDTSGTAYDLILKTNNTEHLKIDAGTGTTTITGPASAVGAIATALTSGTVSTSGSNTTLNGSSTVFKTDFHVGAAIKVGSVITSVVSISADDTLVMEDAIETSVTGTTCTRDSGELFAVKTGDSKTLFGVNETGAIQAGSAAADASASNNIAIGDSTALDTVTTAVKNVVIGTASDNYKMTIASSNVFVGHRAGEDVTEGSSQVFIGQEAGITCTTGYSNVLIGQGAGNLINTGHSNTAIGRSAMKNGTGQENVAIGLESLDAAGSTNYCTAVGRSSLGSATGNYNTALGHQSGDAITTGQQNISIGAGSDCAIDVNNQIAIGYGSVTDGVNKMRLGNATLATADIKVDWTVDSDERIKENIQDADAGLDFINALRPVSFTRKHPAEWPEEIREKIYKQGSSSTDENGNEVFSSTHQFDVDTQQPIKDEFDDTRRVDGLIAQEVKAAIQSTGVAYAGLSEAKNGKMGVQYATLVVPLIKAVQELTARIAVLEAGD